MLCDIYYKAFFHMKQYNRIITEAINNTVITRNVNEIRKLLGNLEQMNLSSYGQEFINFAQKVKKIGYGVVNSFDKQSSTKQLFNRYKGYNYSYNPNMIGSTLSKYGFKIPNEGLTDNVYNNFMKTYKLAQSYLNGDNETSKQQEDPIINVKKIMSSTWPQTFTEYVSIVRKYKYVLQQTPSLVSLIQRLDEIYQAVK